MKHTENVIQTRNPMQNYSELDLQHMTLGQGHGTTS